jgi:hypothetical protein
MTALMVLLKTGMGYEAVLNANHKQLGKMIRQKWDSME